MGKTTGMKPGNLAQCTAILARVQHIKKIEASFSISEQVQAGLYLEKIYGSRQGQRADLHQQTSLKKNKTTKASKTRETALIPDCLTGRTDAAIAQMLGLSTRHYHRAKKVCLQGIPPLIKAMNQKKIPIKIAEKIASLEENKQLVALCSWL